MSSGFQPGQSARLMSLELFRAQCFTVSSVHFTEYLSSSPFESFLDPYVIFDFLGRFFTAFLTFSFGANLYFARRKKALHVAAKLAAKARQSSDSAGEPAKIDERHGNDLLGAVRRGVVLFSLGIFFNAWVWDPETNILDVDILIFYAFAAILMELFARLSLRKQLVLIVLILLMGKVLHKLDSSTDLWISSDEGDKEFLEDLDETSVSCAQKECKEEYGECLEEPGCEYFLSCLKFCDTADYLCFQECRSNNNSTYVEEFLHCGFEEECFARSQFREKPNRWTVFAKALLFQGHYSLVPWMVYPVAGYATSRYFFAENTIARSEWRQRVFFWLGLPVMAVTIVYSIVGFYVFGWTNEHTIFLKYFDEQFDPYPNPTLLYCLVTFGGIFALLSALEPLNREGIEAANRKKDAANDQSTALSPPMPESKLKSAAIEFFVVCNRYLLTMYCAQHFFLLRGQRWYSKVVHGDEWYYWKNKSMPAGYAAILGVFYVLSNYPIMKFWETKLGSVLTLEWIIRVAT